MISFLRGKIIELGKTYIILDVQGVGYRVHMPTKALNSLAKNSQQGNHPQLVASLFTKTLFNQRDGTFEIFGFPKRDDLDTFELLTSISGIGPKSALNILSSLEINELVAAVSKEDEDYLRKISGLGPKTAKRLVVELKDKLDESILAKFASIDLSQDIDAIDALVSLGYQKYQAQEALRRVSKKTKGLEGKVKEALRLLNQPK